MLLLVLIISFTIFSYEHFFVVMKLLIYHMLIFFHGTQSRVHRKGLLSNRIHSYPKNLKVNDDDDTIVNLNVPKMEMI